MVFNGDANDQDLCTLADTLVKTDDIDFPLKEKAMYANMGMRQIWSAIFKAYGGWILDDSNQTTLPEATGNLTLDQFYSLPEDLGELSSIEWKDSSGSWNPLIAITLEGINDRHYAESEFMKTPGNPTYYRPVANGFKLYPAADTARASAIRIKGNRDILPFAATTTSVSPGFDSLFHEAVANYMAFQYAKINQLATKADIYTEWLTALDDITKHYGSKYRQMFPAPIKHRPNWAGQFTS